MYVIMCRSNEPSAYEFLYKGDDPGDYLKGMTAIWQSERDKGIRKNFPENGLQILYLLDGEMDYF